MSAIRFDGRVVLVTGSGRGLGAAYAKAFASRGASVVVHDAGVEADESGGSREPADSVAAEIQAAGGLAAPCYENLESEAGCVATVEFARERFGRLDAVVQNAGLNVWEELDGAHRSWERMRRVNVDASFHVTRLAYPLMKEQGWASSDDVEFGRAPVEPETIAEGWAQIEGVVHA